MCNRYALRCMYLCRKAACMVITVAGRFPVQCLPGQPSHAVIGIGSHCRMDTAVHVVDGPDQVPVLIQPAAAPALHIIAEAPHGAVSPADALRESASYHLYITDYIP